MGKKKCNCKKGSPAFMSTWGDMCTLLLCFFVMLLAMSVIDPNKFMVAASSFQNAFSGVLQSQPTIMITKDIFIPRMGGEQQNKRMAIDAATKIQQEIQREELEEAVKVHVTETGIAIKLADPVGFATGSADLNPRVHGILQAVSAQINEAPGALIRVEGHTDNVPINTPRFPSNWELSASRALSVVRHMAQQGGVDAARLSAVGYGEYRPLVPNNTAENRRMNRRIEIYIDYVQRADRPAGAFN